MGIFVLLQILANSCIIKQQRATLALDLYQELNEKTKDYNIDRIKDLLVKFEASCKIYVPYSDSLYSERINNQYVAGFFDAEGCITLKYNGTCISVTLSITQRSNQTILKYINEFYDIKGTITLERLLLFSYDKCEMITNNIFEYLLIKKDQAECFQEILQYRSQGIIYDYKEYYDKLSLLKRKVYDIGEIRNDVRVQRELKDLFDAGIFHKREYIRPQKKAHVNKITHLANISIALSKKKRTISDELINQVKMKINDGIKQSIIAKEMNLSRYVVNNIARDKLLPLSLLTNEEIENKISKKREILDKKRGLTKADVKQFDIERVAIAKRGYNVDLAINILDYVILHKDYITQSFIANKSKELFEIELSLTQIIGIITGKVTLYKSEFGDEDMYLQYKAKLDEVKNINFMENARKYASISNRKISAIKIIECLQLWRQEPMLTHKMLAERLDITESQVRNILNGKTKMLPIEFPIANTEWSEYVSLL